MAFSKKKEVDHTKRRVRNIYICLIVVLIASPLLEDELGSTIIRFAELLSYIIISVNWFTLWSKKQLSFSRYNMRMLLIIFFGISVSILARVEWKNSLNDLIIHLLNSTVAPQYVLPFVILPLPNYRYRRLIYSILFYASWLAVPIWFMNSQKLVQEAWFGESLGAYLPMISAFLLVFDENTTPKRKLINVVLYLTYLLLMILNARRNVVFYLIIFGTIAFYVNYVVNSAKKQRRNFVILLISFILPITLLSMPFYEFEFMERFNSRIKVDSRSVVEAFFMADYINAPVEDWVIGRGADGGYYQKEYDLDHFFIGDNRKVIETGYLNMILKGGFIYALAIVMIMLIVLIRLLRVKGRDAIALRLILLLFFIDLYATLVVTRLDIKTVLFWLIISLSTDIINESKKRYIET